MALEGTLKDFALPDIFQLIGLQKKTGTLYLKHETDEVTITFKDGCLVSADSRHKRLEGRLGTMLVRSGLITEVQLMSVLEKQKQTLQRLGVLLVNDGYVRQEELKQALDLQVTQIIYKVFRWEDAEYRFDQDDQIDYDRENVTPIGAESVLMEGMRILDEWPIVEKVVRSLSTVYEKARVDQPIEIEGAKPKEEDDDFDFDLGGAKGTPAKVPKQETIILSADEGKVWELVDGQRTLEDVMYLARISDFATSKAAHDLINRDLIREKGQAGAPVAGGVARSAAESRRAEAPRWLVGVLYLALAAACIGNALWVGLRPGSGGSIMAGLRRVDVERQHLASLGSRLDRIVHAVEAHRLADGDEAYVAGLDVLTDLGYLRRSDLEDPWGGELRYERVDEGRAFSLKALDSQGLEIPGLQRVHARIAPAAGS